MSLYDISLEDYNKLVEDLEKQTERSKAQLSVFSPFSDEIFESGYQCGVLKGKLDTVRPMIEKLEKLEQKF